MGGCLEGLEHTGDSERTTELSAFTLSTFVHGGTEPAWAETAFNPAEAKSVQCARVLCVCRGILFDLWLGGVLKCAKTIKTFLDCCFKVSVAADKVTVFSASGLFHCCFQGILEVGGSVSPSIWVHVLFWALLSGRDFSAGLDASM